MPVTAPSNRPEPTTATPAATPNPPRRQPLQLALILVAAFMVVLDFSIVNVALPSIERELHMPADAVQWIVTGYAISFGGLLILGGRAADLLGRRRMFVIGLVAFALASLAGGLAQDPVLLIAARVVQGAGAAIVAPAALSLITTGFPEGPERTRAIGLYGAVSSVGFVAGQVLGGVLVQLTSWRAVFLVNVPVGLIAAAMSPAVLGKATAARNRIRLDVRGALLITGAVTLVVFAVSQGVTLGWTSPLVIAAAAAAAAAAAFFMKAETRHPAPLIKPALLHRKGLRDGTTLAFLLGLWNGGEMLVLSLYLQQVLHESPLFTGLIIAPQGVVGFAAGVIGPRLAGKIGVRRLLVLTAAAAAAGCPGADPVARDRLQPGAVRGHADRLRHRGHRAGLDRAGQPRHGRRRPGPGRRHDQHQPPDRCRGGRGPAAGRGRERQRRDRGLGRPRRDVRRGAGRAGRHRRGLAGREAGPGPHR